MLLFGFYCRRHQAQDPDSDSRMSHPGAGNNESDFQITHDYEEIKDTRHLSDSQSGNITACNAAQLPTIPSDAPNTVYSAAQLPTIPSDAPNTVYSAAQLPTIPSDAPNTVYSAAQLPTIPSDAPNTVYSTIQYCTSSRVSRVINGD